MRTRNVESFENQDKDRKVRIWLGLKSISKNVSKLYTSEGSRISTSSEDVCLQY